MSLGLFFFLVKESQVCIGILIRNSKVIGFTRVVGDFIYKAIIFIVMVSIDHQWNS